MLHEEEAHIKGRQLPHHTSCCFLLYYYQVFTFFVLYIFPHAVKPQAKRCQNLQEI